MNFFKKLKKLNKRYIKLFVFSKLYTVRIYYTAIYKKSTLYECFFCRCCDWADLGHREEGSTTSESDTKVSRSAYI